MATTLPLITFDHNMDNNNFITKIYGPGVRPYIQVILKNESQFFAASYISSSLNSLVNGKTKTITFNFFREKLIDYLKDNNDKYINFQYTLCKNYSSYNLKIIMKIQNTYKPNKDPIIFEVLLCKMPFFDNMSTFESPCFDHRIEYTNNLFAEQDAKITELTNALAELTKIVTKLNENNAVILHDQK